MSLQPRRFAVVAWLLVVGAISTFAASPELTFRTWTDRGGEIRATAAVANFDGKTVKLRNANGTLESVQVSELSAADQAYLADLQRQQAAKPASGRQSLPIVTGVFSQLKQAVQGPPNGGDNKIPGKPRLFPLPAAEPEVVPADLVHVRVSADYLRQRVERAVERQNAFSDEILGTQVQVWATTIGRTGVKLESSDERALLSVTFAGIIGSRTVGTNGTAILHGCGETLFEARSRLVFGAAGVHATPAAAMARTSTTTHDIESTLPGLRGRIVERAARRKSNELRPVADQIAANHAARRIATALNQELKQAAAGIERTLVDNIGKLAAQQNGKPSIHFRSTPEYLHLVMRRAGAAEDDLHPPAVQGNPHISVRVHRLVVGQAISDPQWIDVLQPLMTGLLASKGGQKVLTSRTADPGFDIQWSADRNWMMIDYRLEGQSPANLAKK